MAMNTMIAPV